MTKIKKHSWWIILLGLLSAGIAFAQNEPGTVIESKIQSKIFAARSVNSAASDSISSSTSLQPIVSETGFISLSVDGLGIQTNTEGSIQVDKPANATVRGAYLASADVWGYSGGPLPNGAVLLNGQSVTWNKHVKLNGGPNHAWADVTSIVASIVNNAPTGIVDIPLKETMSLDGSILAVIFDDPNQHVSNTVILLFGAQQTTGDTFNIGLAEPVDKTDPNLILDLSLGISYGYQAASHLYQYSTIDINGQRMTSCAGGQDDGYDADGGLITAGGVGDSNDNPSDPYACPSGPRWDDELYSLLSYVQDGDTKIKIDTLNPSNNDSIYFAALFLGSTTAVVGEGVVLAPASASSEINKQHTVTATVQDDNGDPVVNRDVTFRIISGPHAGLTDVIATNSSGKAVYTYTGIAAGTDTIVASFIDSNGDTITSNEAIKEWVNNPPVAKCKDIQAILGANGHVTISPADIDNGSYDPDPGDHIALSISKSNFTCSDVGVQNLITLTVTDDSGESDSCVSKVTTVDKVAPVVKTKNVTVQLNAGGTASIAVPDIDNGSTDNCCIASRSISKSSFTCADVGQKTVTLTVKDCNGNISSAPATVTVEDKVAPVVKTKNVTVQLNAGGSASIAASDVDNGSADNCCIASRSISKSSFTCADVGQQTVTLTVTDCNGNVSSAPATVIVQDKVAPVVKTKDITVQLDANGNVSIVAPNVDGGTTDACGIASLSINPQSFTCSDLGSNTVTLTATDVNGNSANATAAVTVEDTLPPIIQLNAPETITPPDAPISFTATATDNCSTAGAEITNYSCYGFTGNGKQHSKMQSCVVNIAGDTLNIIDSGGVSDNIVWTVVATDPSGNTTTTEGHVLVENPSGKGKK